jgi:hypothetical protein
VKQKHETRGLVLQAGKLPQVDPMHSGFGPGDSANAGVRKLEMTGAVQAIAPAAPIRFSADRLEIR